MERDDDRTDPVRTDRRSRRVARVGLETRSAIPTNSRAGSARASTSTCAPGGRGPDRRRRRHDSRRRRHRRPRAGNTIAWHWWSEHGELSSVELRLDEHDGFTRLRIVETALLPAALRRSWSDAPPGLQPSLVGRHLAPVAPRRHRLVRMTSSVDAGTVLAALADPTRREVLAAVAARPGTATATDLAAELPVTRQAIAKHLGVLAARRPRHVGTTRARGPLSRGRRIAATRVRLDRAHRGQLDPTCRPPPAAPRRPLTLRHPPIVGSGHGDLRPVHRDSDRRSVGDRR